jgi:AmmeMemoRadiSam system protein A
MYRPKTIYTEIALSAICDNLKGVKSKHSSVGPIPVELMNSRRGCFVSLHKTDGSLRGCIGTIEPYERNLAEEISKNAVSAAFHDNRFNPVTLEEMNDIELSVDVLTVPEEIHDLDDLDPLIYGVIVTDNKYHRALLLPSIPTIDAIDQQIEIVKRKAGLSEVNNDRLTFFRFTSNRYH